MDKLFVPFTSDFKQVAVALITFLYVDFLDTSGTLLALVSSMGYVDENGDFPKSKWAFSADAIATIIGSLFGLDPETSYAFFFLKYVTLDLFFVIMLLLDLYNKELVYF